MGQVTEDRLEKCTSNENLNTNCNRKKKEETTIETMSNLNDIYQPNTKYEESLTIKNVSVLISGNPKLSIDKKRKEFKISQTRQLI